MRSVILWHITFTWKPEPLSNTQDTWPTIPPNSLNHCPTHSITMIYSYQEQSVALSLRFTRQPRYTIDSKGWPLYQEQCGPRRWRRNRAAGHSSPPPVFYLLPYRLPHPLAHGYFCFFLGYKQDTFFCVGIIFFSIKYYIFFSFSVYLLLYWSL